MWETIYKDLVAQLGGPIGVLLLATGWLLSYGLGRACFFLYKELSNERKRNEEFHTRILKLSQQFNQTVLALNQTIKAFQEKEDLIASLRNVLEEYIGKSGR